MGVFDEGIMRSLYEVTEQNLLDLFLVFGLVDLVNRYIYCFLCYDYIVFGSEQVEKFTKYIFHEVFKILKNLQNFSKFFTIS